MEVLVGSTAFGIEPPYGRDAAQDSTRDDDDVSSESSSSIGTPSDDDDDDRVDGNDSSFNSSDEAESKFRGGGRSLASLNSLEENLPIKRGLSNHFAGKSKSFASLADVCTVRDLKKTENPLNKRRRLLIASKWAKKSFYSSNPKSMPLLALKEDDDDDDDDDFDHDRDDLQPERLRIHGEEEDHDDEDDHHLHHHRGLRYAKFHDKRFKSFKARCFSLADLQEHSVLEDDDDDDDDD